MAEGEGLTREDKKKIILGIIHSAFHMDVTEIGDEEVAELILKVRRYE